MNKSTVLKLYNDLGFNKILTLYTFSCLIESKFNKDQAYDLIDMTQNIWLERYESISTIADMLYEIYERTGEEFFDMTFEEVLNNFNNDSIEGGEYNE